jgi:hypothetical protein
MHKNLFGYLENSTLPKKYIELKLLILFLKYLDFLKI